ncbi:MAG: cytochrome c oxidase subunit 3 [Bacteroidota bacterium]
MSEVRTAIDSTWVGGRKPFKASYGKLMMWFFLLSDAFSFSTLLLVYGVIRFSSPVPWADPETVYTHFPGLYEWFHIDAPLAFVGLMTFILIASSVTMVLAVEAGHRMDRKNVEKYMAWTLVGGFAFLACQAYEWYHFIIGTHGELFHGSIHLLDGTVATAMAEGVQDGGVVVMNGANQGLNLLTATSAQLQELVPPEMLTATGALDVGAASEAAISGAGLKLNQYAQNPSFANLFFFITGFHGTHVASGVLLNYIIYKQVCNGVMEKRGHYEMVEKVGLYWHFVDLVWVFVFTFFYLI